MNGYYRIVSRYLALMVVIVAVTQAQSKPTPSRPNILLITVDDMSCDSVGAFGAKLKGTTPHIDRLAGEGLRFTRAHVQTGACMPSRNAMFSGRYSHNNGVEGFYHVRNPGYPVLVDLMRNGGYFTAIRGKVSHSTPYHPYQWDLVMDDDGGRLDKKNPSTYGASTRSGLEAAKKSGKPFYLNINISDPHKPFYAEGRGGVTVDDPNIPSRVFTPDEVPVPGFLPDDPVMRKELAHYYSSVRRADDCVAEILKALEESGESKNTAVFFLSDHGMPLPFAKTQLYHHSTHTPLIVRWPGVTKPGAVDSHHMIGGVDLLPTFLDLASLEHPKGVDGRSFAPLIFGKKQGNRDMVFKEHNENSGASRNPMRAVQSREYLYIFNPWSNGTRKMGTATDGTATYRRMKELAKTDEKIAARLKLADHRVMEELYHVSKDPDALVNLADDPRSKRKLAEMRNALENWMKQTGDPLLPVFQKKENAAFRDEYVNQLQKEANERRAQRQKRANRSAKVTAPETD